MSFDRELLFFIQCCPTVKKGVVSRWVARSSNVEQSRPILIEARFQGLQLAEFPAIGFCSFCVH